MNIKLHVIPAGMTGQLQPLDVKIFGPFAKYLFRKRLQGDPEGKRSKLEACADMVRAWERVTPDQIEKSFAHLSTLETWFINSEEEKVILEHHHRKVL